MKKLLIVFALLLASNVQAQTYAVADLCITPVDPSANTTGIGFGIEVGKRMDAFSVGVELQYASLKQAPRHSAFNNNQPNGQGVDYREGAAYFVFANVGYEVIHSVYLSAELGISRSTIIRLSPASNDGGQPIPDYYLLVNQHSVFAPEFGGDIKWMADTSGIVLTAGYATHRGGKVGIGLLF